MWLISAKKADETKVLPRGDSGWIEENDSFQIASLQTYVGRTKDSLYS